MMSHIKTYLRMKDSTKDYKEVTMSKYINGLKDGEWYYSPDGPVDKIELYSNGKLIKFSYR